MKNTNFPPIKDGVKADNSTYSSNQIEKILTAMNTKIDVSMAELAEKLNSMRTIFEINVDYNAGAPTMNKTYPEIKEAVNKNALIVISTKISNSDWVSSLADFIQDQSNFITISSDTVKRLSSSKLNNVSTIINASEYYTNPTVILNEIE